MERATITSPVDGTNGSQPELADDLAADSLPLDLRGVRCPLSWARAKVHLERLSPGQELRLLLDEARGVRDIPRAAEAEGYAVIGSGEMGEDLQQWWVLIQR